MRIALKVIVSLVGLVIGQIILGYILSIPQVVDGIIAFQMKLGPNVGIPITFILMLSFTVVVGALIIRMVIKERQMLGELRYSLYDNLETLKNYKRINKQFPNRVSDEDIERIIRKIKKIYREIKNREPKVFQ
ncbi:MAG TPA: hypothetical protein VLD38_00880 [Nitrosopumilaceae archaeon]|nr:hypothetical protein [Nitrosopumilaceae archaeon]